MQAYPTDDAWFWERVDIQGIDDCWRWKKGKITAGYGELWLNEKVVYAHRVAYTLTKGPLGPGVVVQHSCDNPPCCNPGHLFKGDHHTNAIDRAEKRRHHAQLFTPDQIRGIRCAYATGGIAQRQLASQYNVTQRAIWKIVNHKSYSYVE